MGIKSLSFRWPLNVYLYTNGLYQRQNEEWETSEFSRFDIKNWKSSACIVAREHYIEEQRTYPINNFYHLLKIINSEKKTIAPFESETFWAITNFKPGEWQVTYWSVQKHVVNILRQQFKILLPESYLLIRALSSNGLYDIGEERGIFFYKNNHNFTCMLKDSLINSKERFCSLLNISLTNTSFESISDVEYRDFLSEQLKRVPPYLLAGFFIPTQKKSRGFDFNLWKKPLILGCSIAVMYALSITTYLKNKDAELDGLLSEKRQEMSVLLKTESELNHLYERKSAYLDLGTQYPSISNLVSLLASLKNQGVHLQQIQLNGFSVSIRGTAESATKVFSALDLEPLITNVDFENAIIKDNQTNKEIFSISFDFSRGETNE